MSQIIRRRTHEHYLQQGKAIRDDQGRTMELSKMLRWNDCPLSKGVKQNLGALKEIRDAVEHQIFGKADGKWLSLFQACCLNFDKALCDMFGERLSLRNDLAFALQFARLDMDQIVAGQSYDVPENIDALDARLSEGLNDDELVDLEYRFRVIYTMDSASKSQSHLKFVHPGSAEGTDIRNVLVKHKPADELYPYKPGKVGEIVTKRSGRQFSSHNHTQAWRKFAVRPRKHAKQPEKTNQEYCIYNVAHGDYTYSEKWVNKLVKIANSEAEFQEIKDFRL